MLKSPRGHTLYSVGEVRRLPVPPYQHVANVLRERISKGELQPGEQLPTLPALCDEFEVTRNTVSRALKLLRDEGLIDYVPGWGTFVSLPRAESGSL